MALRRCTEHPDSGRWSKQASGKDSAVIWPHACTHSHSLGLPSMLLLPLLTQKQAWELTGRKGLYTAQHSPLWLGEGLDSSLEMHRCCLALLCCDAEVSVVDQPKIEGTGLSSFFGVICYGCSYAYLLPVGKLLLSTLMMPCKKNLAGFVFMYAINCLFLKPLPIFLGDYAPSHQLLFKLLLVCSWPK